MLKKDKLIDKGKNSRILFRELVHSLPSFLECVSLMGGGGGRGYHALTKI